MSMLQIRGEYLNDYERAHSLLSQKKGLFYEEDWQSMVRRGQEDLDMWINALSSPEINYEKLNEKYNGNFDYLDSENRKMAIFNEVREDKNEIAKDAQIYKKDIKGNYMYDKDGNPLMEKMPEMTEYEYTKYIIQENADYNKRLHDIELAEQRKAEMDFFTKTAATIAAAGMEFTKGFMTQVENIAGVFGAIGNMIYGPISGQQSWNPVEFLGKGDYKFWSNSGINDLILDFEKQYSGIMDTQGNMNYGGKLLTGMTNSIGQMLPSMITCMIPGVGSVPGVGSAIFYSGVTAGNINEVYNKFQTKNGLSVSTFTILSNAAIKSTLQLGVELILPKILGFGPSGLDSMMFGRLATSTAGKTLTRAGIKRLTQDFLEEGLEEVFQDTSDYLVDQFYYLFTKKDFGSISEFSFQNLVDSFVIGGLTSLASSGAKIIFTQREKTGKLNFDTDKDGNIIAKEEKLGKLASWEYGLDYQSFVENVNDVLETLKDIKEDDFKGDTKSLNKFKAAFTEVYASYRMITSLYNEIGSERIQKANELLKQATNSVDYSKPENLKAQAESMVEAINEAKKSLDGEEIFSLLNKSNRQKLVDEIEKAGLNKVQNVENAETVKEKVDKMLTPDQQKVKQQAHDLIDGKNVENLVTTKEGTDVVYEEKSKTVIAPQNMSSETIQLRLAEKNLINQIKEGYFAKEQFKGVKLDDILTYYKKYSNNSNAALDDAILSMLDDINFFKELLFVDYKANKDILQFVEAIVYEVKNLKIESKNDKAIQGILNARLKVMKNELRDYYLNIPLSNINTKIFTENEKKDILNKRWELDKIESILVKEDKHNITQENIDYVNSRIEFAKKLGYETKYSAISLLMQPRLVIENEFLKIVSISNHKYNFFGRYDGIIRMKPNSLPARQFNNYLDSLNISDINSLFNENYLTNEELNNITENNIDIITFRKNQFRQYTNNNFYIDIDKNNNIELYTKDNKLIDINNINYKVPLNKELAIDAKQVDDKMISILDKNLNSFTKNYLTITDVITNPNVLDNKIKQDIINKYGDLSEFNVYYYLKDYMQTKYNLGILNNNDGDYVFVKIVDEYKLLKNNYNLSIFKNKTSLNLSDIIEDKYLVGRLKDTKVVFENIGKDKAGKYNIENNIITINSFYYNPNNLTSLVTEDILHEFQHAVQAQNNLMNGNDISFLDTLDDNIANDIINDLIKNLKLKRTKDIKNICNQILYYGTGEHIAYGNIRNDTYLITINDNVLTTPWGSSFTLKYKNNKVKNSPNSITDIKTTLNTPLSDKIEGKGEELFRKLGYDTDSPMIRRLYDLTYGEAEYGIKTDKNEEDANKAHKYVVNNLSNELLEFMRYPIGASVYDNDMKNKVLNSITPELREQSLKYLYNQYFWYVGSYEEFLNTNIPISRVTNERDVRQSPFVSVTVLSDPITLNNIELEAGNKGINYSIIGYAKPKQFLMVLEDGVMEALINPNNLYNTYTWNSDLSDAMETNISKSLYALHDGPSEAYSIVNNISEQNKIELEQIYEKIPSLKEQDNASLQENLINSKLPQAMNSFSSFFKHKLNKNKQLEKDYNSMDKKDRNNYMNNVYKNEYIPFIKSLDKLKLVKRVLKYYADEYNKIIENEKVQKPINEEIDEFVKDKPKIKKEQPKVEELPKKERKFFNDTKIVKNDADANKTIYLSQKKYKGTNLDKFGYIKKDIKTEIDQGTALFILNATDKIDNELWKAVKSGKFYKQMAINYLLESENIDNDTFELINNSYFNNKNISTFKELKYQVETSDINYALMCISNIYELRDKLEITIDENIKKGLDKIYSQNPDTSKDYTDIKNRYNSRVIGMEKYLKLRYMQYFDGSIGSGGYIASLASKIVRAGYNKKGEVSLQSTFGKENQDEQALEEVTTSYENDLANDAFLNYVNSLSTTDKINRLKLKFTEQFTNPKIYKAYIEKYGDRAEYKILQEISQYENKLEKMTEKQLDKLLVESDVNTALNIDMFTEQLTVNFEQSKEKEEIEKYAKEQIDKLAEQNVTSYKVALKIKSKVNSITKSSILVTNRGNKRWALIDRLLDDEVEVNGIKVKASDIFEKTDLTKKVQVKGKGGELKERLIRSSFGPIRLKEDLLLEEGTKQTREGKTEQSKRYISAEELNNILDAVEVFRARLLAGMYNTKNSYKNYIDNQDLIRKNTDKLWRYARELESKKQNVKNTLKTPVTVTVTPMNIIVDNDVQMPNILSKLIQTEFVDYANTKVQYFSEPDDKHIKMNWELFVDRNVDMLTSMTQQDVDDFITFMTNGSLIVQGIEMRQYFNTLAYLSAYIASNEVQHNFKLTDEQRKVLTKYITETGSFAAQYTSNLRVFEKLMQPNKIVAAAISKKCDLKLTEQEEFDLAKAIGTGDGKVIFKTREAIIKNILKDKERSKQVGKRSVWDKLLEWERMAMLSGPGTWIRNQTSNILVTGANKMAEGTYKLLNNIFKFKGDTQIQGQYKIIGTKVTEEVKQYIAKNIIENGIYDVIADGITKYDSRKTSKLREENSLVNLEKMIRENIHSQVFRDKPNWKPLAKTYEFIMKMMSDDASVKKAFISYLGKILTERIENKTLSSEEFKTKLLSSQMQEYIAEAYTMAAHDYMHKGNFWNDVEKSMRRKFGEGAFFAYKQIMPFASASWNWFMEAMKFTPVGLGVAIKNFIKLESGINKMELAQQKGEKVFNIKFQQYIAKRNLGKGIIGGVGMLIGAALAAFGLAKIDKDDNDEVKLKIGNVYVDISEVFGTSGLLFGMNVVSLFKDRSNNDRWTSRLADALGSTFSNIFIDDSITSLYNTIRYVSNGDSRALVYYPYTTLTKFIPNFLRTISGVAKQYNMIYPSNQFGKYGLKLLESMFPVSYFFPHYTDVYTGEPQVTYNNWIVTNVINKLLPIKFAPYKISDIEETALSLGVNKGNLTGKYTINNEDVKLSTTDLEKLNMLYGKLNKSSLQNLTSNKQKYRVYDEKTNSYKELYFRNMTDKEKAAAIKQVMSKNSDYSKVYILTSSGKYKYYASDSEYKELVKLGIKQNVYRKTNNKEGFVKI